MDDKGDNSSEENVFTIGEFAYCNYYLICLH